MMTKVTYIGRENERKWKQGQKYMVQWKAEQYRSGTYRFMVIQKIVTRINKKGNEEGYQLVTLYKNPYEILTDWDFTDLRKWSQTVL